MDRLGLPEFEVNGTDVAERWSRYTERIILLFKLKKITDDEDKINCLLFYGGNDLMDKYKSVQETNDTFNTVVDKLDKRFNPISNKQFNIYNFQHIVQAAEEPFGEFVQRLREKAKFCGFTNLEDMMISQIITRCSSEQLKHQALSAKEITLPALIEMGLLLEGVSAQIPLFQNENNNVMQIDQISIQSESKHPSDISASNYRRNNPNADRQVTLDHRSNDHQVTSDFRASNNHGNFERQRSDRQVSFGRNQKPGTCYFCGGIYPHRNEVCRAKGKKCLNCGKLDHLAAVCRAEKVNSVTTETIRTLKFADRDDDSEAYLKCWVINKN